MESAAEKLRRFREEVRKMSVRAGKALPEGDAARWIRETFRRRMDDDMDVKGAFDGISRELTVLQRGNPEPGTAAAAVAELREIDGVLNFLF